MKALPLGRGRHALGASWRGGDRLAVGDQAYRLVATADGSAALTFDDGGVIILQGVSPSAFNASVLV